ncbi:NAD-dependent epimerase/dehydratase family protein [Candidatus Fonsibacter ubiquis]|uniref:NAD-dependent epimerase/dehydratase family protein n=1 Tax=Candidatus Fonsibacter ubiquis TaxID=1925548 RepID=UPI000C06A89C|nr:NAD-dependent epimerase/dehydratase family protein [Candidatus Fonsibacter ubiquis]
MSKKNILITGGFGLLGRNLFKLLNSNKYNVFILDKKKNFFKKLELNIRKKNIIIGNYLNKKLITDVIKKKKINTIFHTGATTQVLEALDNPKKTYTNNIFGTIKLLEAIKDIDKKIIFIFSSSDKAYGEVKSKSYKENTSLNAIFPYDLSKTCADLICQSYSKVYNLKVGILRCGNLYGPGDLNMRRIVPETIISALMNKNIIIRSNGKLVRDYLHVSDAANAYFLLMKKLLNAKQNLQIYNVGSKYNLSVLELVKKILNIINNQKTKIIIKNFSKNEIKFQKLNFNKITKELKWKQKINMDEGLKNTIDWYKQHFNSLKQKININ